MNQVIGEQNFDIIVDDVSKGFAIGKDRQVLNVLDRISFTIPKGMIVSLVGPNGCGKTTLLNILARILSPDSGRLLLSSRKQEGLTDLADREQDYNSVRISYVVQNYSESLFPWKAVWDNISLPLELKGVPASLRKKNAQKLIDEFYLHRIIPDLDQYPYQLSGGQKQACNIARALMHAPQLLLMDEPFVSLDFENRLTLSRLIYEIIRKSALTTVLVSHDIDEALLISDVIIVLTRKPTRIAGIVRMPSTARFEDMTKENILQSSDFIEVKNRVMDLFRGVLKEA